MPAKRDLTSGSLAWNLFILAAPLALGMALRVAYSMADAFWLGKVSTTALAAPGVVMPLFFIVISLGMGFGSAGTALVAQYTGAGSDTEADKAAAQTLLLLCGLAFMLTVPTVVFAPSLLRLLRVPPDVIPEATTYLRLAMLGLPFVAFTIAYGAILRALGDTITVVLIGVATNVLNMLLDPILIFGLLGMPRLEVKGAAIVTLFSQVLSALACLWCLRRRRGGLRVSLADLKPDPAMLRRIGGVGIPLAISNSSNSFGIAVFQVMINSLGTVVVAAVSIGFKFVWFFNIPAHCMAMAAAPVVGQALGAGRIRLARRAVWSSFSIVALVMFPCVAALMAGGRAVASAFINEPDVVAEAGRFFLVVPASSYFFGVLMVLMAAFYGSGHTRPAMVISVLRLWAFRLPAAYLLGFVLHWGSMGVYFGMVIGNVLCAVITLWLFFAGGWESAVVPTRETKDTAGEEPGG
ncbi:MAG: MATE family efflux transporter [Planctomycetota bacterium]